MSEQELIVILKVRTRQQQNSWPSDKEFLEQIIDNPARTNEPKKRWEATLIVGILIIFSKIIFLLLPLRNHNWIFNEVFVYCSLRHVDSVTFSHGVCPWGFHELFLESIKIKEIPPMGWCRYEISCLEAVRLTCSWHQKTKTRIIQFTNLKCCIKAREPFKSPC